MDDLFDPDALDEEVYSGEEIVLDAIVREHLWLELPMQPLCREDCAGIAIPDHVRGPSLAEFRQGDVSVDPRLAPLLKLHSGLPESEE